MKEKIFFMILFWVCSLPVNAQTDVCERVKNEAWNTIKTINRLWAITENMDSLKLFLHEDMVIIYPDAKERLRGRDKIIESYKGYTEYAQTIYFKELNPLIQLYNDNQTAVVTYYYDFEITNPKGEKEHFSGRDMYTLIYSDDRWWAVAQHFSPMPK